MRLETPIPGCRGRPVDPYSALFESSYAELTVPGLGRTTPGIMSPWRRGDGLAVEAPCRLEFPGRRGITGLFRRSAPWEPIKLLTDDPTRHLFEGALEVTSYAQVTPCRKPDVMQALLDQRLARAMDVSFFDCDRRQIARVTWDPAAGDIISVETGVCTNPNGTAEALNERVYWTNSAGQIRGLASRKEVRERKVPYLISSVLMWDVAGERVLLQKRSALKAIDPGALSTSAHGVVKAVYTEDGQPLRDCAWAGMISAALELNEELRHGHTPFSVQVWPGTMPELMRYLFKVRAEAGPSAFSDTLSDTLFLVNSTLYTAGGYALHRWDNPRTRFITLGVPGGEQLPGIFHDPAEVAATTWMPLCDAVRHGDATADILEVADLMVTHALEQPRPYGHPSWRAVQRARERLLGVPFEDPE